MITRRLWLAALLSSCVHLTGLGVVGAIALWPRFSPPVLLEAYGDSNRAGFAVDVVAIDPGAYRQGDAHTPGGDNAPEPRVRESVPVAVPATPAPVPPEPVKPKEAPKATPPTPPVITPPPAKPKETAVVRDEKPAADQPAQDPAANRPAPAEGRATGTSSSSTGGAALPGAPGGARLPQGTPSAGGRLGSRTGAREVEASTPPYPGSAREAGLEGTPIIWLRISTVGRVADARVHRSCGHQVLDEAALRSARGLHFIPARRGGTPVEAEVLKPVEFSLY